jgi:hypothetical protein
MDSASTSMPRQEARVAGVLAWPYFACLVAFDIQAIRSGG